MNSELHKKDGPKMDPKMDPKKNVKGQPVFNVDAALPTNEQGAGQRGNGRRKGRGRPPSAFQEYLPDVATQ